MVDRVTALPRTVHREMPRQQSGPQLAFRVFHVLGSYAPTRAGSRHVPDLPGLLSIADAPMAAVGPVRLVFP